MRFSDNLTYVNVSPWMVLKLQAIRQSTSPVSLTAQGASIGVTAIPTSSLASGLYRVSYYCRITTAAGVSSSLIVTFSFTDGGVACSFASAALTDRVDAEPGVKALSAHALVAQLVRAGGS